MRTECLDASCIGRCGYTERLSAKKGSTKARLQQAQESAVWVTVCLSMTAEIP